jgi:LysM repeat protein
MGMLDEERSGSKKEKAIKEKATQKKTNAPASSPRPKPRPTTIDWDANKNKTDARTYTPPTTTVDAPAPKTKVVQKNNTANVIAGRQARGLSMLEAQNQRRNRQGKVVSAADASYGYIDANGKFVDAYTDATNGGGPGRAGPEFQTKSQAIDSPTGGEKSGTLASFLGATPKDSNLAPTGIAKFIQDGGVLGTMAKGLGKGIKGVAQDIGGAFKPASYTVKPGDNLSKIAAKNNMTLEQLLAKNPGLDPKKPIQPKQQIKIGGLFGGTQTPEQAAANAAMMAQMDNRDNNGIAAAPVGVQGVQCPAGQVFNPVTNSCEPALSTMTQAAQTSMPAGIPGIDNPSYEQIIAYRNNPQQVSSLPIAPGPLTPNLSPLTKTNIVGQLGVRMAAEGGIMSLVEAEGGNEKTLISDAIAAIESGAEDEAAAVALAKFVQVHGEDALRNLVEKVQSGDYADTRERFANGENGIVNGPGDGSGTDDKVPATIDGKQDVLLTNNEYVLREPTTAALEAALGKGGLDAVNAAEGDAPAVLRRLMNNVQAERQTA